MAEMPVEKQPSHQAENTQDKNAKETELLARSGSAGVRDDDIPVREISSFPERSNRNSDSFLFMALVRATTPLALECLGRWWPTPMFSQPPMHALSRGAPNFFKKSIFGNV